VIMACTLHPMCILRKSCSQPQQLSSLERHCGIMQICVEPVLKVCLESAFFWLNYLQLVTSLHLVIAFNRSLRLADLQQLSDTTRD